MLSTSESCELEEWNFCEIIVPTLIYFQHYVNYYIPCKKREFESSENIVKVEYNLTTGPIKKDKMHRQ